MDSVDINKLEWDIAKKIDDGETDEQIANFVKSSKFTEEDLVKVIRKLYGECLSLIEELAGEHI